MWCPLCYKQLTNAEHHPGQSENPAHWLCGSCDCRVNEWDDEYERPVVAEDAPQYAG
jgi:hypothetical protein